MKIRLSKINKVFTYTISFALIIIISFNMLLGSGAYDNGTSTGKGKVQVDVTWNPFNYFKNGQTYMVISYGINDKIDLQFYYADHGNYNNGIDSYYFGILYQFVENKYIDLATAIGSRKMLDLPSNHIFFPQLLYNIKIYKDYTVGGSIVNIKKNDNKIFKKNDKDWRSVDIGLFIPITNLFEKNKFIEEVKLGIGVFKTRINTKLSPSPFYPTYSIDFKINLNHKNSK